MIVQHTLIWSVAMLILGTAIGLLCPLPFYLPLLAAALMGCLLLRRSRWQSAMVMAVWLLLGCSRASVCSQAEAEPAWLTGLRSKMQPLQEQFGGRLQGANISPRTKALCTALVMGNRNRLEADVRQSYANAGVSHLLALSGMHLGIIYGLLYLLIVRPLRHGRWRWWSLLPLLTIVWSYTFVTGLPVSLVRAALMLSLFSITLMWQYKTDALNPLFLSAAIILMVAPRELQSIGFQMSFVAVLFILSIWSHLSDRYYRLPWVYKMLIVSVAAQLGTMPLVLYYFHQMSLLAPLLSIILIPLTAAIIYLTLAAFVIPCAALGWVLDALVSSQDWMVGTVSRCPGATLTNIYPNLIFIATLYAFMLLLIILMRTSKAFRQT